MKPEDKMLHALMAQALAHFYSKEVNHGKFYSKQESARLEKVLKSWGRATGFFDRLTESKVEDSAVDVYDVFYDYVKAVAVVGIPHMNNITKIIEAYNQDPQAIEKAVGEILKQ